MLFNSHEFLFVFLPLVLLAFHLLSRQVDRRFALAFLTAASFFFYGWWNPHYLLLIIGSIGWNYMIGRAIHATHRFSPGRRLLLTIGVIVNLALLVYFKYLGFLVENFNWVFVSDWQMGDIVLPLAISFFTFQQIAYLVDAYRNQAEGHSFLDYCLFVTFFPQLIAGPIVHHTEMLPQLRASPPPGSWRRNLELGTAIFFIGLFKKVVIADGVADYANPVFAAVAADIPLGFVEAWGGALAYTFQLYFDFSGYSDMAIGLGMMFGVRLPLNFHSPYQSTNIVEFWRRWHMTLSRFLRDYLYISLGGSRHGRGRRYLNLMITMLLGGLWHGAGWTFAIWGALHGTYLVVCHVWQGWWSQPADARSANAESHSPRVRRELSWLVTFLAVVVGWVLFRAENVGAATSMLGCMCGLGGWFVNPSYFFGVNEPLVLLGLLLVVKFAPNTQQIVGFVAESSDKEIAASAIPPWLQWRPTPAWAISMAFISVVSILHLTRVSQFLYFQF